VITDEQIIYDALRIYRDQRQRFAVYVHKDDSLREDGEEFTDEEKADALQVATQCDRLAQFALKKLKDEESQIIRVN
jgi:hypothetical protein